MARRKNTKRIDPRYFLHETVNRGEHEEMVNEEYKDEEGYERPLEAGLAEEMNADIAKQIDQIALSATQALRGVIESGQLSVSRDPEARAAASLRSGAEAPANAAGSRLQEMIMQYIDKLDEAAALQLGRGGSSLRGGEAAASLCGETLGGLPPCPDGEELCALMRNAVGYLACLEQGDGGRWLEENGLASANQQIYGALNDELRNRFH